MVRNSAETKRLSSKNPSNNEPIMLANNRPARNNLQATNASLFCCNASNEEKTVFYNVGPQETLLFFENHYSHIFYIVYDAFVAAELSLRQKGPHKAQREELEAVLYLLEKVKPHGPVLCHFVVLPFHPPSQKRFM